MTENRRPYAVIVAAIGEALYGTTWAEHLARNLGVAKRGVERVKAAAAVGEDYPAAKGYLDKLPPLIAERVWGLTGLQTELASAIEIRAAEKAARDA
jgi:hypothetical protein